MSLVTRSRVRFAIANTLLGIVCQAATIPAGTILELRLRQELNSYSSQEGSVVQAYLCAPVVVDGKVFLPMDTTATGRVRQVKRVGLGLIRERAILQVEFDQLTLPNGERYNISTRVVEVENGREKVSPDGKIRGIRSTDMPGYRSSGVLVSLAAVDPIALAFSTAASAVLLRFPEPEIRLPTGTELMVRLSNAITLESEFPERVHKLFITDDDRSDLRSAIQRMPYRTHTQPTKGQPLKRDSDLTNFVLVGSRDALERAFGAAGWVVSDKPTASANYRALRAFAENQGYEQAPMSILLLDGHKPVLSLSKAMNTFHKRHHIRIFSSGENWNGHQLFTASATQDTGVVFSTETRTFIHRIDKNIDNERAKILNDLALTGCLVEAETMDRAWVPKSAKNATGEGLVTDGAVAILRLSECYQPRRFDDPATASPGPYRGNAISRASRQTFLTVRYDLYRGSFFYQGFSGAIAGMRYLKSKNLEKQPRPDRQVGISSDFMPPAEFVASRFAAAPIGPAPPPPPPEESINPWEPPKVELGFGLGFLRFVNKSSGAEGVQILHRMPTGPAADPFIVIASNLVDSGISFGGSVTLNSQRWISHELGFFHQRGKFKLGLQSVTKTGAENLPTVEEQDSGLLTRQFTYNTLVHMRPRNSRFRPYVAAGPVIQLLNLSDSPFKKARGLFRFGLNNVGMIEAAYNFGHAAPLEGGGIFQLGMQGGAGFKYRVAPRWTFHVDFRGTVSKSPDFLKKSLTQPNIIPIEDGDPQPKAAPSLTQGLFRQQRVTGGFSFTF